MLKFLPSPAFRFNEQLLTFLKYEGGRNEHLYKRVFVNLIEDGLYLHTMARYREIAVRLIENGIARVSFTNNNTSDAVIAHRDYDRKDIQKIAEDIAGYLEDRFDPSVVTKC